MNHQPKRPRFASSIHGTVSISEFIATTPNPLGSWRTELRRDVSQDLDDNFEILIDSNHGRRGAYVFQINPLGTQVDGLIVEEQGSSDGRDFDRGWDGVWTSESRIIADGWTRS